MLLIGQSRPEAVMYSGGVSEQELLEEYLVL